MLEALEVVGILVALEEEVLKGEVLEEEVLVAQELEERL